MTVSIPTLLLQHCKSHNANPREYEIEKMTQIEEPIFLRNDFTFIQNCPQVPISFTLSWLTISQCKINFKDIRFKCKIQVTAKSHITAENCSFIPYDGRCECAVEIFANSKGSFTNCNFKNATKAGIAIRDRSEVSFDNCSFSDSQNTSVLVLDKSRANFNQCKFSSAARFSIYLYRNSSANIESSFFNEQNGKAIFMLTGSHARIISCKFNDCKGGGISIADTSEIYVKDCTFYNIGSSSIHAMKKSKSSVTNCNFMKCRGNGVNFEYSTGYVCNCYFNDFDFPAIACFGPYATPVIFNSKLENCHSIAIVSRDCAAPVFSKLKLYNIQSHGFSISDFSHTIIEKCVLQKIQKSPLCVFNGATPTINNCIIKYDNDSTENLIFQAFTNGKVIFKNNLIISNNDHLFVKIHNFGKVVIDEFKMNYFYRLDSNNENLEKFEVSNAYLLNIDEQLKVNINANISKLESPIHFISLQKDNIVEEEKLNEEEEEEEESNESRASTSKKKAPPKSVMPKTSFSVLFNNAPKIPSEANQISGNSILFSKPPEDLPETPQPKYLPKPLKEIDIENLMKNECQIPNDNQTDDNNNNDNNQNGEGDVDAAAIGHLHLGTCLRCKNGLADHVSIPCGHKVLCKNCADECTPPKPEVGTTPPAIPASTHTCPLCETPIQRCTEEFVEELCVICLDNPCDTIILPCGHRCICYECATQLWTEKKQCPLCQTRVLSFRHMFQIYSDEEKREAARKFLKKE